MYQFLVLFVSLDNKWVQPYFGWFDMYVIYNKYPINCKKKTIKIQKKNLSCHLSPGSVALTIFSQFQEMKDTSISKGV